MFHPGPEGQLGMPGPVGPVGPVVGSCGGGRARGVCWPRWWARGVHSAVSCLLYFSCFSPSPPALLMPWVWLRAVPTYGPYGRFCSRSARLSCTSVLVTVTGMPLSLAPSLCPSLLPHGHPWVVELRAPAHQGLPSKELACLCPGLSLFWNMPCLVLGHSAC